VNPKYAFVKKKDAENHVALRAIRKLRSKGYLDKYLFPCVQGDASVNESMDTEDSSMHQSFASKLLKSVQQSQLNQQQKMLA
jgi:hypothetical protein